MNINLNIVLVHVNDETLTDDQVWERILVEAESNPAFTASELVFETEAETEMSVGEKIDWVIHRLMEVA
jgi:hypothetical protein